MNSHLTTDAQLRAALEHYRQHTGPATLDDIRRAASPRRNWHLDELTVSKTQDEFGQERYFVTDFEGDWIGEPFDTAELAFAEIDRMGREGIVGVRGHGRAR